MKKQPIASPTREFSDKEFFKFFKAPDPELIFKKADPDDFRLGNFFVDLSNETLLSKSEKKLVLLGYPDDEGIRIQGGRSGAAKGPDSIRNFFYRMTPCWSSAFKILDGGNLDGKGLTLQERHQTAQDQAQAVISKDLPLICLGGGHDYGFPDASAFLENCFLRTKHLKPVVLNLDAHLDVRPFDKIPHSGTPFRRLLEKYPGQFHFIEIGLQPHCNSLNHKNWLLARGGHSLGIETIEKEGLSPQYTKIFESFLGLANKEKLPLWVSLDIDVFHQNEAPGCSQSWPRGLSFKETLPFFRKLFEGFDMKGLGIYEVSPPLDSDGRTSKLAALFAYEYLRMVMEN